MGVADEVFFGSFIDQADGFCLALRHLNHRFAFPFRALDDRQLLLFRCLELPRRQQAHRTPLLFGGLLLVHSLLDVFRWVGGWVGE